MSFETLSASSSPLLIRSSIHRVCAKLWGLVRGLTVSGEGGKDGLDVWTHFCGSVERGQIPIRRVKAHPRGANTRRIFVSLAMAVLRIVRPASKGGADMQGTHNGCLWWPGQHWLSKDWTGCLIISPWYSSTN